MKNKLFLNIKKFFLAGLFILIPIVLTGYITIRIFFLLDNFLQELIYDLTSRYIPGLGFLCSLVIILIAGIFTTNVLGRNLIKFGENMLNKIPLIKVIYFSLKEITNTFSFYQKHQFLKVVLIEYPRKNLYVVGYVTNTSIDFCNKIQEKLVPVFLPTTPNPTSGLIILVPESEIIPLSITIEESAKFIVSGGIIIPDGNNKSNQEKTK